MASKALSSTSNIKLVIAYEGKDFLGWQKTAMGPSIEEALQTVLERILQQKIALQAASRTDAGAHAEGQVVNFFVKRAPIDLGKLTLSLNRLLPSSIAVLEAETMPLTFHPTLDARAKEYHYHICYAPFQLPKERYTFWHCPSVPDLRAMQECATLLQGKRDFSPFTLARKKEDYQTLIRELTLLAVIPLKNKRLRIEMRANNFLYRMARTLAGTLMAVGQGKLHLQEVLKAKDRRLVGMTAPAHGLTLHRVFFSQECSQSEKGKGHLHAADHKADERGDCESVVMGEQPLNGAGE